MHNNRIRFYQRLKPLEWIIILILAVGTAMVWWGFFQYRDPYIFGQYKRLAVVILWTMRLGIPLLFIGVMLLYYYMRAGRIKGSNAALLVVSLGLMALICYPVVNAVYMRSMALKEKAGLYHPYLQLTPAPFEGQPQKGRDAIRIMCLGGSTTEFADSTGKGWPQRVEAQLRTRLKTENIEVYNMGRQWYTTLHTLINYQTNLRQHKPDLILVMHTINDLLHNADFSYLSHGKFRADYGHFYGPVNRIIVRRTLWQRAFKVLSHFWYQSPRQILEPDSFQGLVPFTRNINTLLDLAQKDGTRVVLMTQPNIYRKDLPENLKPGLIMLNFEAVGPDTRWNYKTALNGFKAYSSAIKEIAAERNTFLLDLEPTIPKTLEFFNDDVHYQNRTFDRIADFISEELLAKKVLDGLPE
jgi:hypothetical protein